LDAFVRTKKYDDFLFVQIDYIKQQSVTKDGKLLAIGHSMGGILLYAMISKCGMFHQPVFVCVFR
jgi:alpha-beta hydrolase superfamily lysophospholipase